MIIKKTKNQNPCYTDKWQSGSEDDVDNDDDDLAKSQRPVSEVEET